jgi:hypothetical protein
MPKDPGIRNPAGYPADLPLRHPADVVKGLGLTYEAERDLSEQIGQWIRLPDAIAYRKAMTSGLRAFSGSLLVRSEIWKRCAKLWRDTIETRPYSPMAGSDRIHKAVHFDPYGDGPSARDRAGMRLKLAAAQGFELVWMTEEYGIHDRLDERPPGWPDDSELLKAAGHKYIKRVLTGKPKPKYRYYYRVPKTKGLIGSSDLHAGAKLKVEHAGREGHFEVVSFDRKKGLVRVRHDESGREAWIKERDLHRMIQSYHHKRGRAMAGEKGKTAPIPRATMADLAKGEWSEVVGFEPTEQAAQLLSSRLKPGWEYAAIKQPGGYMVVARRPEGDSRPRRRLQGKTTKVFMRKMEPMTAQYVIMEADDIIASHNPVNYNIRPEYPEGVQEREYHEKAGEKDKVDRIARQMEPAFLINTNPDAVNGAPIITQDNIVLGGNGRTMGMQRAYAMRDYAETTGQYLKDYLVSHAQDFGFKGADVRRMKAPILVRRMRVSHKKDETEDRRHLRLLGRRMNENLTQGLDPRIEEVAIGKNFVDEKLLRRMVDGIDEGETLAEFLQSERSREFVRALWTAGVIDEINAAEYQLGKEAGVSEGLLNEQGRTRVERVLAAKFVPNAKMLDRMNPKLRQALANSAAYLIKAQDAGWDIQPQLYRAIQIDQSIRAREKDLGTGKRALKKFLRETELPGVSSMREEVLSDPVLHHMLVIIREKVGTTIMPRDFREFAIRAAKDAEVSGAGQAMLGGGAEAFGIERESIEHALNSSFGVTAEAGEQKAERARTAREEKRQAEAAKQEQRAKVSEMKEQQGGLFAASMPPGDLRKAGSSPLVDRVLVHARWLIRAAVTRSLERGRQIVVDEAKIVKKVMAAMREGIAKDPDLSRDQGANGLDVATVKGLVSALVSLTSSELRKSSPSERIARPPRLVIRR